MARGDPLDGHVLILAAAKASVPAERLPRLVDRAQADLGPRFASYRRGYEAVHESPARWVFLVPPDHWASVGDRLGFTDRECEAIRRAHEEQLRRIGGGEGRREEFESALDIRSAVVIGTDDAEGGAAGPDGDAAGDADERDDDRGPDAGDADERAADGNDADADADQGDAGTDRA
jgi:hypothetical protein